MARDCCGRQYQEDEKKNWGRKEGVTKKCKIHYSNTQIGIADQRQTLPKRGVKYHRKDGHMVIG